MAQYFLSTIDTFTAYCGKGVLPLLFIAAVIYILFTEQNQWKKLIMGVTPIIMLVIFFIPVTRMVYVEAGLENVTYYRFLWLLPMGVDIAYAACRLFDRHRRIGLVVTILVVIACSGFSLVYRSQYIRKATNRFHIDTAAIDICNLIAPEEGAPRVRAAVPPELVYFIRQYDTDIMLAYGRDYVEAQWDYWNAVCEQMSIEPGGTYDIPALVETTREAKCEYVVLNRSLKNSVDHETVGLIEVAQLEAYTVYLDPEVNDEQL